MPLEIIGVGYGRTGTFSTKHALDQLGYPCYHMFEVLENKANKDHLEFWNNVANGKEGEQYDWNKVFYNYRAAVDNPACCVWKELVEKYPDAKVLLTLHPRGADAWYESTMDTIYFSEIKWQFKFLRLFMPFAKKFGNMSSKLIWQRSHKGTMANRKDAIEHYNNHIAEIKASVPADKLLVFSVDQGWEPLCGFLRVPVPDTDFPRVNDRNEIKKAIKGMTVGAYVFIAIGVVLLAGIGWGLSFLF